MKRVLPILLCILLLSIGSKASALEISDLEGYTQVSTVEEFDAAFKAHKNIRLMADIDMTNSTCNDGRRNENNNLSSLDYNHGTITGLKGIYDPGSETAYYKLKNLNHILWDDISNINLMNIGISGATSNLFFHTKDCEFNEVYFEQCGVKEEGQEMQSLITVVDEGSTFAHISIMGCKLYFTDPNSDIVFGYDHDGAGFLAATKAGGTIENIFLCSTNAIYSKEGEVGSLVGEAHDISIKNVNSFAIVIGYNDRCGGIVGNAERVNLTDCHFYGMVKQANLDGMDVFEHLFRSYDLNEYWNIYNYYSLYASASGIFSVFQIGAKTFIDFEQASQALANSTGFLTNFIVFLPNSIVESATATFVITFSTHMLMWAWGVSTLATVSWQCLTNFSGPDEVGGIAGYLSDGSISKCSNYGMVYALDAYAGGIVGYAENTTITKCLNHGAVHGDEQTGGLVGYLGKGSITHSLNIGSITCANTEHVGRIVGQTSDNVTKSYNYYIDKESDIDNASTTNDIRLNISDLVSGAAACYMNQKCGEAIWHQTVGSATWPSLSTGDGKIPTEADIDRSISTVIDVKDRASLLAALVYQDADINVVADIDMKGYPAFNLSSAYMPFRGRIRGNGHHIKNISFTQNDKTYLLNVQGVLMEVVNVGIFGVTDGAIIEDLHFDNVQLDLAGNMQNVGLLVGNSKNSTYRNITMTGMIYESDGKDHSIRHMGGLIGYSDGDVLENCTIESGSSLYTWGSTAYSVFLGGLTGFAKNTTFKACANYATVRALDDIVGGITGTADNCQFTSCVNYGHVAGYNLTGGIVGTAVGSSIVGCANHAMVSGSGNYLVLFTDMKDDVGGIAGRIGSTEVSKCLNSGYILGDEFVGGIAGEQRVDCNINHCINIGKIKADYKGDICYNTEGLTSSYNYYLANSQTATGDGGTTFTTDQIRTGWIAMTMNQDLINSGEAAIWRQELGKDILPSNFDTSKPLVTSTISEVDIVVPVYNANDFYMAIYLDRKAKISLQADIDLNSMDWNLATSSEPFEGEINGNGHVISNLQIEVPQLKWAGLFEWTKNAKFENFIIDNFHFTQELNDTMDGMNGEGLLASDAEKCTFKNITVRNSSITLNKDKDYLKKVGGIVASCYDCTFEDITIESSCEFYGCSGITCAAVFVGGVAGKCYDGSFTHCHNAAHIWGDDNNVGGICGWASGGSFDECLNSGWIEGQEYVGGIAGKVEKSSTLNKCVNIGTVSDDEHKAERWRGGIVGCMDGDCVESYCMNFGTVYDMGELCGALEGALKDGSKRFGWNYYNFMTNGGVWDNNNGEFSENMDEAIPSGLFAQKWGFYQSIDNDGYITDKPVPIPAAGTVYLNHRCDGTSVYTNLYHGEEGHTADPDDFGYCRQCGLPTDDAIGKTITITNAQQLKQLADYVAAGLGDGQFYVELANDIDMSELGEWTGIGSRTEPYRGTFDGCGHRILNMHAVPNPITLNAGFFACLGDGAVVRNLIIDASCQVTGSGRGVAGIAGAAVSQTDLPTSISIRNCGNEANVTGELNAAGILGVLYDCEQTIIRIYDCYNMGDITGDSESAAIIGYGQKWLHAHRCWNTGTITGADSFHSLFRYNYSVSSECSFGDNYYSDALLTQDYNASPITDERIVSGKLCYLLNASAQYATNVWGQNLGTEMHPTFSTLGLRHERTMKSRWGTVMLPFELTSSDDVTFFEISSLSADFTLTLQPVQTVAPNTPCFFRVAEGTSQVTFSFADNEWNGSGTTINNKAMTLDSGENLWLIGSYLGLTIQPDKSEKPVYNYFIAQDQLWWGEVQFDLPPYRAYICIGEEDESKKARSLSLNVIDEEGIEQVLVDDLFGTDTPYNLNGQRQQAGQKGLQIRNGKVILIK